MIATVAAVDAALTVSLIGSTIAAALWIAGRQLDSRHLAGLEHELAARTATCEHPHTLYLGEVLVDYSDGKRWLDGVAVVERCVTCGDELVGTARPAA